MDKNLIIEDDELLVADEVITEELEQDIEITETVDTIEVEAIEEIQIGFDEAIGWTGGDSTRHYSLYGRDEPDQHPITAITGLREELNDIEALDVVYSDERNQANYYLWEDENLLQENRVGYFVSACSDINEIKICTSDNDIFGVTVNSAGFIGAQADIARDIKYGLVVTTGVVHVRCEQSVEVGDYVISNDYGYAQKNNNGYKVVGRHQIDGVEYAEITLVTPIGIICELSDDIDDISQRMDDAEGNMVAAINMANAAYNKAGEAASVSKEVLKDALEALKKSEEIEADVDKFLDETAPSISEAWKQAQAIAESAASSAITAKDEAVATANDAWSKSENVASEFQSLTAKIDQYSVGEYSQAYGLTLEQAKSILKAGMIYVPTKHSKQDTHSETYLYTDDDDNEQKITYYFTPGGYYEWSGSIWIEHANSVAFFSEEPTPSRVLQYWYIDSNDAPEGYEAYALYVWEDDQWQQVNILAGNASNRLTSMIRQTADAVSIEVANARGSYTGLDERLTNTDAQLQLATFWNQPESEISNLAAVKLTSSDVGSNLALVIMSKDGERQLGGASIVLGQDDEDSYIKLDAKEIHLEGYISANKSFAIDENGSMTATGGTIGGWKIDSDKIYSSLSNNSKGVGLAPYKDGQYCIWAGETNGVNGRHDTDAPFKVEGDGTLHANKGIIGGWDINSGHLESVQSNVGRIRINSASSGRTENWIEVTTGNWEDGSIPFRVTRTGKLYASGAIIDGESTFNGIVNAKAGGSIAGWGIESDQITKIVDIGSNQLRRVSVSSNSNDPAIFVTTSSGTSGVLFKVDWDGSMYCSNANITGTLQAGSIITSGTKFSSGGVKFDTSSDGGLKISANNSYMSVDNANIYLSHTDTSNSNKVDAIWIANKSLGYSTTLSSFSGKLSGTWAGTSAISITSDINKKNSIGLFDDKYEVLFDSLIGRTFKYNDGFSGRVHTGFIAQEVKAAMDVAKIDTMEFAGLTITNCEDGEEEWALRYTEFVALNTWQIQKAKARITELEERVSQLEKLINKE